MRKIALLLLLCMSLLALCPPLSTAQGTGVIQGRIVNGTAGGASVGGLGVELRTFQGQSTSGQPVEGERLVATADAQGQFRIEGLPATQDSIYQLVVTYQGVVYSGPALQFESGSKSIRSSPSTRPPPMIAPSWQAGLISWSVPRRPGLL
jgi:hypothetical protein